MQYRFMQCVVARLILILSLKLSSKTLMELLIFGRHHGDCHHSRDSYRAARPIHLLKQMLFQPWIEVERLRLDWVSAAEGNPFICVVNDATAKVRELGLFAL